MKTLPLLLLSLLPTSALAEALPVSPITPPDWAILFTFVVFVLALLLSVIEEYTGLHKSTPVMVSAAIIWGVIAHTHAAHGAQQAVLDALTANLVNYADIFFLLLVTMTYVNALNERNFFAAVRGWIAREGYSYKTLYWTIGITTFILTPLLDNLSTILVMGTVVFALGRNNPRFVTLSCISVVVAANAGGVFSPFGDISSLILWQQQLDTPQGPLDFSAFFSLLLPALVGYLVPAALMHQAIPTGQIATPHQAVQVRRGTLVILLLFLAAIATAVLFETVLHMPPVVGMMTGLSYVGLYGYYLKKTHTADECSGSEELPCFGDPTPSHEPFDIFHRVSRAEWDALFFLYGIGISIGGLAYIGWLQQASTLLYGQLGPDLANIAVGLYSAFIENVPTIYGVLAMDPALSLGHWLMVALTTALGGSLLSIGSAAGIVLMGQSGGQYTFIGHLRWTPAILLGFAAGIACHYWINARIF